MIMGEPKLPRKDSMKVSFSSKAEMLDYARKGITKKELGEIAKVIEMPMTTLATKLPVTLRTIQRYKPSQLFKIPVSDHALEIAGLYDQGFEIFGSKPNFINWMDLKNIPLGGVRPSDLLDTSIGISMIEDELGRIEHGVLV